jgi:hypothetical protein
LAAHEIKHDELVRVLIGQRPQQDAIDQAEDGGVGADS